jgi:hypothetical protein
MSGNTNGWEEFLERADIEDLTMIGYETYEEYEEFLRALYEELTPHGIMEENQVFRLAKVIWSRNRIDRYAQLKMRGKQIEISVTNRISYIAEKLKPLAPKFLNAKSVKEVEELLEKLEDPIGKQLILARWPLEKCKPAEAWGGVIAEGLSSLVPDKRFEDDEEFFKMVEHFPIDEDFGTLERMDASIDRTLKRLMQLKTMKQMFRQLEPKLIVNNDGSVLV